METKLCKKCNIKKPLAEMVINGRKKEEHYNLCKKCDNARRKKSNRTKMGIINQMYSCSVRRCRKRGHIPPEYTKEDFKQWVLWHIDFDDLFKNWVQSDYNKNKTPSIDRIDDFQGYSFSNIRLVTWKENHDSYIEKSIIGIAGNRRFYKSVVQLSLRGAFIKEYISASAAAREHGINGSSITSAVRNRGVTANSAWAYAKDYYENPLKYEVTIEKQSKEVYQLTLDGIIINKFSSSADAMAKTGILKEGIYNVLRDSWRTAGGYKWIRVKDYHNNNK